MIPSSSDGCSSTSESPPLHHRSGLRELIRVARGCHALSTMAQPTKNPGPMRPPSNEAPVGILPDRREGSDIVSVSPTTAGPPGTRTSSTPGTSPHPGSREREGEACSQKRPVTNRAAQPRVSDSTALRAHAPHDQHYRNGSPVSELQFPMRTGTPFRAVLLRLHHLGFLLWPKRWRSSSARLRLTVS